MRKATIWSSYCGVIALLGGCVTTEFTEAGAGIRLTSNPDVVRGCKFLGNVTGSDLMQGGMLGQAAAEENATRRMQNEAGARGANVVMITTNTTTFSGSTIRGEAFQCEKTK